MHTNHLKIEEEVAKLSAGIAQITTKLDEVKSAYKMNDKLVDCISEEAARRSYVDKETGFAVISLYDLDILLAKLANT